MDLRGPAGRMVPLFVEDEAPIRFEFAGRAVEDTRLECSSLDPSSSEIDPRNRRQDPAPSQPGPEPPDARKRGGREEVFS